MITISGEDGEFEQLPIIDVLEDPIKQRRALADLGITETVQQTLFNFGNGDGDTTYRVLEDTLKQVAGAGQETIQQRESESPTQPPRDRTGVMRLTTGKFLPNFGITNERYEIRREHARGGMGRIMLARDKAIGRDIALKELLPGMATGSTSIPGSVPHQYTNDSGGIVERFLREAKITGQLEHPNIVPVYEIGKHDDGSIYYTMRFVRGLTLSDRLRDIRKDETLNKQEKLAARIRLLDSFVDVCQAIAYAHSKGVIHRDLKPENIMLGEYGETQVLDWGLARLKGQEDKALKDLQKGSLALSKSLIQSDSQALTLDGSIVGTPAYMPPEQARGELEQVDEKSDVYALGAVLYQILTGHPPYEGPMAALIVQQVLSGPPLRVTVREKSVPPELEALVEKAMAREKKDRISSALELASEVKAFRDGRTLGSYQYSFGEMVSRYVRQHRTAVGLGVLGFLVLVAATIFFVQRLTEQRDLALTSQTEAEQKTKVAQTALQVAQEERLAREKAEADARKAAQKQLDDRVDEAKHMMSTIDGMRIQPALADLSARVSEYEVRLAGPPPTTFLELPVDEQVGNGVLLSSLLGYVSAKQSLIDLLTGPAGTELPEAVAQIDLETERKDLAQIRLDTARLATINGDFPLALLLLSGADSDSPQLQSARELVETARTQMLELHRKRISEALADVEAGLNRDWRDADAPTMDAYVKRLSSYRERQTVDLLKGELDRLMTRDVSSWNRPRVDLAVLICRVLGNVDQPSETVPVLAEFLGKVSLPELVLEASLALCAARSTDAFDVLVIAMRKRGMDYWREIQGHFAAIPMPARVREPATATDWIDRSVAMYARHDFPAAEMAASRALVLDERSAEALLHRALANRATDRPGSAEADLDQAIEIEPEFYEALLERGRLLNDRPVYLPVLEDFTTAINLRPRDWRGYRARGSAYGLRYKINEAIKDYEKALSLEPDRLELYLEYAERLKINGRYPAADAQLSKAVERWPEDWRTWSARAWIRREANMPGGMEDARKGVELNPDDASSWDVICQIVWGHGRFIEGIEAGTKAVTANPNEWLAWYYRGLHYHKWSEKEDSAWRATRGDDGARQSGGIGGQSTSMADFLQARTERLENAVHDFRQALTIEPEDFRTSYLLANTLIQLQRYDEAAEACAFALQLSPFCYMRWGGFAITEVRFWADALQYRALMNTEPKDDHQRIGKAMLLALSAAVPVHMSEEKRLGGQLKLACELLRAVDVSALSEADVVFYAYGTDRVVDSLMAGGGREFYFEAVEICERREKLGQFIDAGFEQRYAMALAGVAGMYDTGKLQQLFDDPERVAEFESMNLTLLHERESDYYKRAGQALLDGAKLGLRLSDFDNTNRPPWAGLKAQSDWGDIESALSAPPLSEQPGVSIYDELILLISVVENSPAWQAGLRKYDNILSINGMPINSTDDFMGAWGPIPEGQEVSIHVRRYKMKNGAPIPVMDGSGKPALDKNGFVTWQAEEFDIKVNRGYLGIGLGQGFIPPRFQR
ncbi:MAG: protein kinase [Planctomycetes bacterium]|nr:protein kinase [Planctomycetota bacterium]